MVYINVIYKMCGLGTLLHMREYCLPQYVHRVQNVQKCFINYSFVYAGNSQHG